MSKQTSWQRRVPEENSMLTTSASVKRRLSSEHLQSQNYRGMTTTCCPGSNWSFWWGFAPVITDWTVICTVNWSWHPRQLAPVVEKSRRWSMFYKDAPFTKPQEKTCGLSALPWRPNSMAASRSWRKRRHSSPEWPWSCRLRTPRRRRFSDSMNLLQKVESGMGCPDWHTAMQSLATKTSVDLLSWAPGVSGNEQAENWQAQQISHLVCSLAEQRCSEAWGTFRTWTGQSITALIAWRKEEWRKEAADIPPSKVENDLSSTRQILARFQGQPWGDCWETGRSAYGPFWALWCHLELKQKLKTELTNSLSLSTHNVYMYVRVCKTLYTLIYKVSVTVMYIRDGNGKSEKAWKWR